MTTPLRKINQPHTTEEFQAVAPGDCWFGEAWDASVMSKQYNESWKGKRPPIFVKLPNGAIFCVDQAQADHWDSDLLGWDISGELPAISVSPSIDFSQSGMTGWHGHITNGELTP